ncbi:MAG: hypothetical protein ACREPT_15425, partial [Rudaea sp.]
ATLVSIPITVDVTSTIYATVTGIANNSSPVYPQKFTYQIILRDSADTTNLATSTGNSLSNIPNQQFLPFNDSQVLAGSSGSYVAAPGNYLLKVVVGGGIVCGVTPISANGELTYILLSSALDRIFANGFALKSNSEIMAIMA